MASLYCYLGSYGARTSSTGANMYRADREKHTADIDNDVVYSREASWGRGIFFNLPHWGKQPQSTNPIYCVHKETQKTAESELLPPVYSK